MKKVEQVNKGRIEIDFDHKISSQEIYDLFTNFKVLNSKFNNPLEIEFKNVKFRVFIKQITYLGHPHPIYKKRIQISKNWNEEFKKNNTLLFGVYQFQDNVEFCHFDTTNFQHRGTNNSSAHISTFDLLKAYTDGYFKKVDNKGNILNVFRKNNLESYFESLVEDKNKFTIEISLFEDFKSHLHKKLFGINCYSEMISYSYRNKFQPEWVGFYLEYKFENFILNNKYYKEVCEFQRLKSKNTIDLDLKFKSGFLGDLKTHSTDSNAILGNDFKSIKKALSLHTKIWYIVFSHNTIKDKDYNYEVTKYWNKAQNKDNLLSYGEKMKNNIEFTKLQILEINNYNFSFVSPFNQGKNSNNLPREPKIKIDKKSINNFMIYSSDF